MLKLSYRNSHGEEVNIPTVTEASAKGKFNAILDQAAQSGAVAITCDSTPKAVILSYDEFESLVHVRSRAAEKLSAEYDRMMARMQTPKAKKAMRAAFNASPAELGRAAVWAARKPR